MKCRLLPHGAYCLVPIAFASMAFWSLLVQDGCDYAQLSGSDMVETVSGLTVYPFLEIGRRGYRPPMYDSNHKSWIMVYTQQCTPYTVDSKSANNAHLVDAALTFSKWCTLISFVFGGSVAFFLWCMTLLTLSIRTWRFCGSWLAVAVIFRAFNFFFFRTHMCTYSTSRCEWFYGAQMDLAGVLAGLVATISIFLHYPNPTSLRKSSGGGARGDGLIRDGSDGAQSIQQDGSAEWKPMTTRRGSGRTELV